MKDERNLKDLTIHDVQPISAHKHFNALFMVFLD